MKKSMATIERIMADELMAVSYYLDDRLVMGGFKHRMYLSNLRDNSPELLGKNINRIVAISWTGAFDGEKKFHKITTANSSLPKVDRSWWQKIFGAE